VLLGLCLPPSQRKQGSYSVTQYFQHIETLEFNLRVTDKIIGRCCTIVGRVLGLAVYLRVENLYISVQMHAKYFCAE
jgi:hypothetical protein